MIDPYRRSVLATTPSGPISSAFRPRSTGNVSTWVFARCVLSHLAAGMDSAASSISPAGPISRSHDEVDLLVQVARQCAIALEASIAYRELSELKEKPPGKSCTGRRNPG